MTFGIGPQDNRYKTRGYSADFPYKMITLWYEYYVKVGLAVFLAIFGILFLLAYCLPSISSVG